MSTRISVAALAREAGVGARTAREWLNCERKTQPAKEAALEAAFAKLGGTLLKQEGEAGLLDAVVALGARHAAR